MNPSKIKLIIIVTLIVLLLTFAIVYIIKQKKYTKLKSANKKLRKKYENTPKQLEELKTLIAKKDLKIAIMNKEAVVTKTDKEEEKKESD
ncbi:MAG: hypothetical protein ACWA41_12515 [Putridiphycobacter sp.]